MDFLDIGLENWWCELYKILFNWVCLFIWLRLVLGKIESSKSCESVFIIPLAKKNDKYNVRISQGWYETGKIFTVHHTVLVELLPVALAPLKE